jgi:Mg2+/Co2+ transporter CorB
MSRLTIYFFRNFNNFSGSCLLSQKPVIIIFVLLFCSALISAAEVAYFSLTPKDLDECTRSHPSKAAIISLLLEKPKKLLATLLVANNFINIGVVILFSFIGNTLFEAITSPILKFIVEVIVVTFLILLFGEVLPKIYASRNNIKFAIDNAETEYRKLLQDRDEMKEITLNKKVISELLSF